MNKLQGRIVHIESSQAMSIVEIDVQGDIFSAILLETPDSAAYLRPGNTVALLFKETEVSVAKNLSGLISIRNRVKSSIKKIESNDILTKIILDYQGQPIVSIISTKSARRLELKENDVIEWLVKTNEISLCATI